MFDYIYIYLYICYVDCRVHYYRFIMLDFLDIRDVFQRVEERNFFNNLSDRYIKGKKVYKFESKISNNIFWKSIVKIFIFRNNNVISYKFIGKK